MIKSDIAISVCNSEKCSACGACIAICPKGCISYYKKETGLRWKRTKADLHLYRSRNYVIWHFYKNPARSDDAAH